MPNMPNKLLLASMMILCAGGAAAHSYTQGAISIGHLWTRPAPVGGTAQIYGPLLNNGGAADIIDGMESPVAASTSLGGDPANTGITLNPAKPVSLRASGPHIDLVNLRQPLLPDTMVPVTLHFRDAGNITVDVSVEGR